MQREQTHKWLFLFGTILLGTSLPLSPFMVTVSQFLLSVNWLFEPHLKQRFQKIVDRKSILFIISVYLINVLWLFNSTNIPYALHDLKIKAPMFVLPIIFGTSKPLTIKELKTVLQFYLAGIFVATLISMAIYLNFTPVNVIDIRGTSPIISHIRLSLLIDLAFYILLYFLLFSYEKSFFIKLLYKFLLLWFFIYLLKLGASTGIVVLFSLMPFAVIYWLWQNHTRINVLISISVLFIICVISITYTVTAYKRFMYREKIDPLTLSTHTINGNEYTHDLTRNDYENQHQIWINICEKELEPEWNLRSCIKYYGKDHKGQFIRSTLIRYMSSLGYTKDSLGISNLTDQDIDMIEKGYTNIIFKNKWSLYPRFYELFWEIEYYAKGGNPSGHSLTQRIEYVKNTLRVIKGNFWFGVGTGDVDYEIKKQYNSDNSQIEPRWRLRTHNQVLTFFLTFGFTGFCWIVFAMVMALRKERKTVDFIFFCFFLIFLFSTINEDTLETQAGATFYAYFLSLLLLGRVATNLKNQN